MVGILLIGSELHSVKNYSISIVGQGRIYCFEWCHNLLLEARLVSFLKMTLSATGGSFPQSISSRFFDGCLLADRPFNAAGGLVWVLDRFERLHLNTNFGSRKSVAVSRHSTAPVNDSIKAHLRSHVCNSILKGVASPWQLDRGYARC